MTTVPPVSPTAAGAAVNADDRTYVDWGAIIAGAVLASAISLLLMTFGSAIGLSLTDPLGGTDNPALWLAVLIGIWVVLVQVASFAAGGYVTGRMRRRLLDANAHESEIRDGLHGLIVWGTGLLLTAILAFGGLGSLANAVGGAVGGAASGVSSAAGSAIESADPFDASVDQLLRGDTAEGGDVRAEVGRILTAGVTGDGISEADQDYLATLVAERTGLAPEEAEARVDEVIATAQSVQDDIAAAAEQARRVAILVAFLTAASLAISAVGAFFAAGLGGAHRNDGTVVAFFNRRR